MAMALIHWFLVPLLILDGPSMQACTMQLTSKPVEVLYVVILLVYQWHKLSI